MKKAKKKTAPKEEPVFTPLAGKMREEKKRITFGEALRKVAKAGTPVHK